MLRAASGNFVAFEVELRILPNSTLPPEAGRNFDGLGVVGA